MNVLLITVDCLRHDRVGCIGGRADLTPNIDRFSRGATVFTQAIAQGYNTEHSFPSIFTSTYPRRRQVGLLNKPFTAGQPTLALLLKQQGYASGGFHSNPWLSTHFGYGHEYDVYEDNLLPPAIRTRSNVALRLSRALHVVTPYLAGDKITAQALGWIKRQSGPFFAWIHYMDAHGPYRISRRLPGLVDHLLSWPLYRKAQNRPQAITAAEHKKLVHTYEEGVRFVDQACGTLLGELESSAILADTLVILTADHGEAFGEHGRYTHGFEHPFDETVRVPLIVRWPGRQTVPRVEGQVELTTIVPTVLDVLGLPLPEQAVGRSAVSWLRGDAAGDQPINPEAITSGGVSEQWTAVSVRTAEWKYILRRSGLDRILESSLYHLKGDPQELQECGQQYPDVLARLREHAEAHVRTILEGAAPEGDEQEMPEEVVARLRSLGYLG